jgi:hypothetical protein
MEGVNVISCQANETCVLRALYYYMVRIYIVALIYCIFKGRIKIHHVQITKGKSTQTKEMLQASPILLPPLPASAID